MNTTIRNIRTSDRSGGEDHSKPFNIASYSLLTMMVARHAGYEPGEFVHTFGDVHLYLNHLDQADLQLAREPFSLPRVSLRGEHRSLLDFRYENVELLAYRCHPAIPAAVSV